MLHERIVKGDIRAAARLMRLADDRDPAAREELAGLFPHTGKAHVIGITGNPGSGKSTLVDMVVQDLRSRNLTVGVIAIDPSSPFTGGAILGDRIRMQRHSEDEGVFIRSLATRGHLGGLTRSTNDVVTIMDGMGFDVVIIETVGVGQDEVDIVKTAHTSVVVLVPGMGDEIQIMKAGILEIADIFVVNKSDRPGAERVMAELSSLQHIVHHDEEDLIPVLKTVATSNVGIRELGDAMVEHLASLKRSGGKEERDQIRLREIILSYVRESTQEQFNQRYREFDERENVSARLLAREVSPYEVAEQLLGEVLAGGG
jgi:LAO/AO transport system kinase